MRNICDLDKVDSAANPMTGTASRARNSNLRSKPVRGSLLNTGMLTVATPRASQQSDKLLQ